MKAIGYIRVSTEKQADFGVSLEAQEAKIRAMAVVQGADLAEAIIDAGESAKSLNRPGMERLLALVDAGAVDVVIIAKLDRLTRSVADLAELLKRFEKRGVSLVDVADSLDTRSAAGRLVLNIMVSVSQWEREAIGERTRDAMGHKKAKGERVGTIPFGYRVAADGVQLEADDHEQSILTRMRTLKAGGLTTRAIAVELNREGFTTRRGTEWRFQYVARVLQSAGGYPNCQQPPERGGAMGRNADVDPAFPLAARVRADSTPGVAGSAHAPRVGAPASPSSRARSLESSLGSRGGSRRTVIGSLRSWGAILRRSRCVGQSQPIQPELSPDEQRGERAGHGEGHRVHRRRLA